MATKSDDKENGCTFLWKIKNFCHCWSQFAESPEFTVDSLKWSLMLYPKGKDEKHVAFYLKRKADCNGTGNVEVNYQLAFLAKDGSFLRDITTKYNFSAGVSFGCPKFEKRERVFVTEREAFLPEDTLTGQCTIWKTEKKPVLTKHICASTVFKVERRSFLWRVDNFSTLKSGLKNTFGDGVFQLDLVLNDTLDFGKKLAINMNSYDGKTKYFSFKTAIVDSEGKTEDCGTHEYFANDLKKGVSCSLLFAKKVLENKTKYLPNDVLSLDCEFAYSNGDTLTEICNFGIISSKSTNKAVENKNQQNIGKQEFPNAAALVNDFKFMYSDAIFSDTELRTSTKSFPAHRSVLSSRSPVFRSMFSNDMKEKNSKRVDISDFDDVTVHRMLLYVYTDSLEDMGDQSASKLYSIADKYQILSLKASCSSILKDNLCSANARDVLFLADLHNDDDLKSAVQDYIFKLCKEIFGSGEWKDFMGTYLKLAADVMCRKICEE